MRYEYDRMVDSPKAELVKRKKRMKPVRGAAGALIVFMSSYIPLW